MPRNLEAAMCQYFGSEEYGQLSDSQQWILLEVQRNPGASTAELAMRLEMHQSVCTFHIENLIGRGYLVKRPRRSSGLAEDGVVLADDGKGLLASARPRAFLGHY